MLVTMLLLGVTVTTPPKSLGLSPFYEKYVDVRGLPLVASRKVRTRAMLVAHDICSHMLEQVSAATIRQMKASRVRIVVMAETEQTTDIPEHSDLNRAFPDTNWNKRARGLGATLERPAISCAEENLLGLPGDRYTGECILVHEFSHTIADLGVAPTDPTFSRELQMAFKNAHAKGLWDKTYAAANPSEYWAEGVQDYFDCNRTADPPNGIHNAVHTRQQLKTYDADLYRLIERVFGDNTWRWTAPVQPI